MHREQSRSTPYIIYNATALISSPLIAAYLAERYFSGKSKAGWRERWGHLPEAIQWHPGAKPRIWVHAVSAGEVVAAAPILQELREELPQHTLLLSVITPAGMEIAQKQAACHVDAIFYFPFDLPWIARRVVRLIKPQVFVSLESELWPNVLHELKRQGAATILVNGRISERSFQRARRIGGALFRWMLGNMDRLLMQSAADAMRVRALGGGLSDPGRVAVLGNSKFDQEIVRLSVQDRNELKRSLRLAADAPVFVAGSTRSSQEEAQVIAAYNIMRAQVEDLCLVIAPRQVDRAEDVMEAMREAGLQPVRKTHLAEYQGPVQHLILDTLGELAGVYAVGEFAFVGNSFEPVNKGGGQNLLQPLAHGKAVVYGPCTATIRSEVALAEETKVGFRVANAEELADVGLRLLHDEGLRLDIEGRALDMIAANRGVSKYYAAAIAAISH